MVIDSSKDPSYLFALHATGRLDLQVLHLVRDSRAVAYSWTRVKKRPEVHWEDQVMTIRRPSLAARRWIENNLAVELFARLGPRVLRVRYEDFAEDHEAVTEALVTELGLPRRAHRRPSPGTASRGTPCGSTGRPCRCGRTRRGGASWQRGSAGRSRDLVPAAEEVRVLVVVTQQTDTDRGDRA